MSAPYRILIAGLALLTACVFTACSRTNAADTSADAAEPATVMALANGLHRITLTADGAQRIGLATDTITSAPGKNGAVVRGPSAAVFYKEDGSTWVYLQTAPLTFQRAQVVIARIVGNTADLSSGPPVGSVVVTVGVAELRGAEDGVPGEQ